MLQIEALAAVPIDPVLKKVRSELDAMYGDRIERVVLFGSRARGDANEDSDYDVAVFLHGFSNRWEEFDRVVPLSVRLIDEDRAVLDLHPYAARFYEERTPLMREIRLEGIDL